MPAAEVQVDVIVSAGDLGAASHRRRRRIGAGGGRVAGAGGTFLGIRLYLAQGEAERIPAVIHGLGQRSRNLLSQAILCQLLSHGLPWSI